MKLPKLKLGDPILITGQDWTCFTSDWTDEVDAATRYEMDEMVYIGFYCGLEKGIFYWSNVRMFWPKKPEAAVEVKYLHRMPLRAIDTIRKLK